MLINAIMNGEETLLGLVNQDTLACAGGECAVDYDTEGEDMPFIAYVAKQILDAEYFEEYPICQLVDIYRRPIEHLDTYLEWIEVAITDKTACLILRAAALMALKAQAEDEMDREYTRTEPTPEDYGIKPIRSGMGPRYRGVPDYIKDYDPEDRLIIDEDGNEFRLAMISWKDLGRYTRQYAA